MDRGIEGERYISKDRQMAVVETDWIDQFGQTDKSGQTRYTRLYKTRFEMKFEYRQISSIDIVYAEAYASFAGICQACDRFSLPDELTANIDRCNYNVPTPVQKNLGQVKAKHAESNVGLHQVLNVRKSFLSCFDLKTFWCLVHNMFKSRACPLHVAYGDSKCVDGRCQSTPLQVFVQSAQGTAFLQCWMEVMCLSLPRREVPTSDFSKTSIRSGVHHV